MTLKRKLLLTTSTLLVTVAPIATVISCGKTNNINNNINDPINAKDVFINVSNDDLIVAGKDGTGTFKFDVSPSQKQLLKEAGASYKYFVKRYKKGPSANFEPINSTPFTDLTSKPLINDLFIEDEIKVQISLNKPGYIIKGDGIFQKKITDKRGGLSADWYKPATTSTNADTIVQRNSDVITIDLNKDIRTNELVFKIAKELGFLFSNDPNRYVAKVADKTTNPITMFDIWNSLNDSIANKISKIIIKKGSETETLNLESMKSNPGGQTINLNELIQKGLEKIEPFKNGKINDSIKANEEIFTKDSIALNFATFYGAVAIPIKDKLLTMIGPMKDDSEALAFIPKLAIGYGSVFQWIIRTNPFKEWVKDNNIRAKEVSSVPNVFMATLFRSKNN